MGTYEMPFVVPNLNKELQRIPISSVILSSQRVDMREALFNAAKDKSQQAQATNPLVHDGQKLIPSVTRVFSRDQRDVRLSPRVPTRRAAGLRHVLSQATRKAFETAPAAAEEPLTTRLATRPLRFSFPLEQLTPGEYLCQVTLLDAKNRKTAFWQSPIMIAP